MTMSSRIRSDVPIGLAVVAGLLLSAGPAAAQVQTEKLQVEAFIGELCTVTSASLNFGSAVNPDVNTDASGSIEIHCATETTFGVALDGGLHFSPFVSSRAMAGGANDLLYTLYKDAGRQTQWGVGETVSATIVGDESVPVYGRIPVQSNGHASGLHTDEVTITLVF
jgi:spore coat protein U-like protein